MTADGDGVCPEGCLELHNVGRFIFVLMLGLAVGPRFVRAEPYPQRWFYLQSNFLLDARTDEAIELVNRAASAGLNGVVVGDVKFMLLEKEQYDSPGYGYAKNVERFVAACRQRRVEVIPFISTVSASPEVLAYDPNLAAGYQVDNLVMEVRNQVAHHRPDPEVQLRNGDFEVVSASSRGELFDGWSGQDAPGKATLSDPGTVYAGQRSLRLVASEAEAGRFCRVGQWVKVKPRRCYRISVQVQTRDLKPANTFNIAVSGGRGKESFALAYNRLETKSTQTWTRYEVVFNSLHFDEVLIHLGLWNAKQGFAWLDQASLQEVGLVNVLRRPGCPLLVRTMDGQMLQEGRDFEPVTDPRLGKSSGGGRYDRWHDGVPIRLIKKLPDNTRLLVTYFHPLIVYASQVDACMSEERVYELWHRMFARCNRLLGSPRRWFLVFSELRQGASCAACQARKQSTGQIMAESIGRFTKIVQQVRPGAQVCVWHDMFDPGSNAHPNYYFVRGDPAGSWLGLDPQATVVNWDFPRRASMNFFGALPTVRPQMASVDVNAINKMPGGNLKMLMQQWFQTMDRVPNVQGAMYTTWRKDYSHLEEFGRLLLEHPRPARN